MPRTRGMQRLELAERLDQRIELSDADTLRHFLLPALPVRLRCAQRRRSLVCDRDFLRARVGTSNNLHETAVDEWVEIARQRRAIEQLPRRDVRDLQRPVARECAQQRELRQAQARRRHEVIVELGQRTRRATQSAAGTGDGRRRRVSRVGSGSRPGCSGYGHMHSIESICTFSSGCKSGGKREPAARRTQAFHFSI